MDKKFHFAIRLTAVALSIAAVSVLVFWPASELDVQQVGRTAIATLPRENDPPAATEFAEDSLSNGAWHRRSLRTRTTAPVERPPENREAVAATQDSELRLLGTIIEPGHSFAMIEDRRGAMDAQPVGGVLQLDPSGYRIEQITPQEVTLSRLGSTLRLRLPAAKTVQKANGTSSLELMNDTRTQQGNPASPFSGTPPQGGFNSLTDELDFLNGDEPPKNTPDKSAEPLNTTNPPSTKSGREQGQ